MKHEISQSDVASLTSKASMEATVLVQNAAAALALTTLAGELLLANARARELFAIAEGADLSGIFLADLLSEPAQLETIEAVSRDGLTRRVEISASAQAGSGAFNCQLARVSGERGIAAWLTFVAIERDSIPAQRGRALSDAATVEVLRRLGGIAVWKMRLTDAAGGASFAAARDVTQQPVSLEVQASPASATLAQLDSLRVQDREDLVGRLRDVAVGEGRLEATYRLKEDRQPAKTLMSRAVSVPDKSNAAVRELWGVEIDVDAVLGHSAPSRKASILDAIGTSIEAPIYAVDDDFRYIYFNDFYRQSMLRIYGTGADPVLGQPAYASVIPGARRRTVLGHLRRASTGMRVVEEISFPWDRSAVRSFEITYAPLGEASSIGGVAVYGVERGRPTASVS